MGWHVRGSLFVDYVRMIRRRKDIDWTKLLPPEDLSYVMTAVDPSAWYPMETFERLGDAILGVIGGSLDAVRLFGRFSTAPLVELHPQLVAPGDPLDTLMRFKVLRTTFFDFDALEMPLITSDRAHLIIRYRMGKMAEEAASHQTMGFCEGLLELAGAKNVDAYFAERSWAGDKQTLLVLRWTPPD